jgi:hypothetical protein
MNYFLIQSSFSNFVTLKKPKNMNVGHKIKRLRDGKSMSQTES